LPRLLAVFLLAVLLPLTAAADRRIGLVIGNDAYSDVAPLDKAVADAEAIAATLRAQGFEILTTTDADRREMNRSISTFTSRLQPGDTAFLFYAGHGVEIDGENYLLPTDIVAPASGERDFIKSESIALSALLDRVRATGARMTIAIIDACRNNPFETTTGRSIGGTRGLGRITAPQGTFVIFSAGAGQLALDELTEDDPARNSVFTRALLPRLSTPGLELRALVADLRVDVRRLARTVNHQQFPAYYDELLGDFYFAPADSAAPDPSADTAEPSEADPQARMAALPPDQMRQDFDLARSIGTAAALQAFLDRYADRSEAFSYRMAEHLLAQTDKAGTDAPDAPPPAPAPPAVAPDRRAIIRDTQQALNAAGCSAGTADGIIGARTRSAFQRFITDTGADLAPADLGTDRALALLRDSAGRRCKAVVAQPAPDTPGQRGGVDLSGSWQFRAKCPLFIQTTGTVRYRRTGPNTFSGPLTDSLGQTAATQVTLDGRKMNFVLRFPTATIYASGTLSADGNSYTNVATNGCSATVWRAG
jgi:uncharacterized caspase-like protein